MRCSVVFENSEKLCVGIKTFRNLVSKKKCGCIAEILRIKMDLKILSMLITQITRISI